MLHCGTLKRIAPYKKQVINHSFGNNQWKYLYWFYHIFSCKCILLSEYDMKWPKQVFERSGTLLIKETNEDPENRGNLLQISAKN